MSTPTIPTVSIAANPLQLAALTALALAFSTVRGLIVSFAVVANNLVPTVSNYGVNASSVCVNVIGADGQVLPEFPVIEVRRTGKFALPSIKSYKEANVSNALLPYPQGKTAFDAALFADSHASKQRNGAFLRAPQAAASGSVVNPPAAPVVPAPIAPAPDVFSMVPAAPVEIMGVVTNGAITDAELEAMTAPKADDSPKGKKK